MGGHRFFTVVTAKKFWSTSETRWKTV